MKKNNLLVILLLATVLVPISWAVEIEKDEGLFLTASNGKGAIILFWYVPTENWPENGWRLSDDKDRVIVDQIVPLAEDAVSLLTEEQIGSVKEFMESVHKARLEDRTQRELFNGLLAINTFSSFEKAKAFGLAWTLTNVKPGLRYYKLTGLDKNKEPNGITLVSGKADGFSATPLPPMPKNLNVIPRQGGAEIFWQPVPEDLRFPVLSYEVERIAKDKEFSSSFKVVKGVSWNQDFSAFTDTGAPVEQDLTYRVYGIDCFGRKSNPASVSLFMPDLMTLKPPVNLAAKVKRNQVKISWGLLEQANPAGFVVERSSSTNGLYETLTPKGLGKKTRNFVDKAVITGISYHYRIRSIGTNGALGEPSSPVMAIVDSTKPVPSPPGLTATVNPILITLNWKRQEYPIAGFIVEKRAETSDKWARLNDGLIKLRTYKDRFAPGSYGVFYYRVTAVGFDNQKSKPGRELKVVLKDLSPPKKPVVTSIVSSDGEVRLTFEQGNGDTKTKTFTVLRDLASRKGGGIIKTDIPVLKKAFVDTDVVAGQGYWYSVVAVDKESQESEWSEKYLVRVIAPDVPKAKKPKAKFMSKPFSRVEIRFDTPPEKMAVSLQRQAGNDAPWITLDKGLIGTDTAVDTHPVISGISRYRIVYHSINGSEGEPSEPVTVKH